MFKSVSVLSLTILVELSVSSLMAEISPKMATQIQLNSNDLRHIATIVGREGINGDAENIGKIMSVALNASYDSVALLSNRLLGAKAVVPSGIYNYLVYASERKNNEQIDALNQAFVAAQMDAAFRRGDEAFIKAAFSADEQSSLFSYMSDEDKEKLIYRINIDPLYNHQFFSMSSSAQELAQLNSTFPMKGLKRIADPEVDSLSRARLEIDDAKNATVGFVVSIPEKISNTAKDFWKKMSLVGSSEGTNQVMSADMGPVAREQSSPTQNFYTE